MALRRIRHALSEARAAPRWIEHREIYVRARGLVTVFYLFTLFVFAKRVIGLQGLGEERMEAFVPLWPVVWVELASTDTTKLMLSLLYIGAGLAGVFAPHNFAARALVCLAILQAIGFANSWGAINHGEHVWFWVSVCLLFLPNRRFDQLKTDRAARMQLITAVGGSIALHLLFYTMSGVYKWSFALRQIAAGELSGLSPTAMANTLAARQINTDSSPLLAHLIIDTPLLGWPMYLLVYYVELVAILVFFRPCLHSLWGLILIMFHFSIMLFMQFGSVTHVFLNGMLLVCSPFAPARAEIRAMLLALPIFGPVIRVVVLPLWTRLAPTTR